MSATSSTTTSARLSQGLAVGDVIEFETRGRLVAAAPAPRSEGLTDGWAIAGCPPGFEPDDGSAVRRLLRRRLAEASEALSGVRDSARVLVLLGAYDYMEFENAGPSLRGFDPALAAAFDVIALGQRRRGEGAAHEPRALVRAGRHRHMTAETEPEGALESLTILDLSEGIAGPYAAHLFATVRGAGDQGGASRRRRRLASLEAPTPASLVSSEA